MTPSQAATMRAGDRIFFGVDCARVMDRFRFTIGRTENEKTPGPATGTVFYGFAARSQNWFYLVKWNEGGIVFYRSKLLKDRKVRAALN